MSRILIVDDEISVRRMLSSYLERAGHQIALAEDGSEAVDRYRDFRPDLIILDAKMPRMNGYRACEILKGHPDSMATPIIILTSRRHERDEITAYSVGADLYLAKPVDLETLSDNIATLIKKSRGAEDE